MGLLQVLETTARADLGDWLPSSSSEWLPVPHWRQFMQAASQETLEPILRSVP
jgi:hypothetical protein